MHFSPKGIVAVSQYRKVGVVYSNGWPNKGLPFGRLEPCDGKLSSTVLRGLGAGNSPRLPGNRNNLTSINYYDVQDKPQL